MEHITVWESDRSPILESLRERRLNSAKNDHLLALEVLAAERCGRAGDTAKIALKAHERCCWSKHWASVMIAAKTKETFLGIKSVDAAFIGN